MLIGHNVEGDDTVPILEDSLMAADPTVESPLKGMTAEDIRQAVKQADIDRRAPRVAEALGVSEDIARALTNALLG